jgi:hypothetical protein
MPAPARAELQHALSELRNAAEAIKVYDPAAVERLQALVRQHAALLSSEALGGDAAAQRDRIVGQLYAVLNAVERAARYPSQITARADVLDRTGTAAKMIRVLQTLLDPQAR